METKTNDWEKQLKGALLLTGDEPIEVIFSGGVSKTIRQIPWSLFVATVEKLRADARKDVITKMEKIITEDRGCCNCPFDRVGQLKALSILKEEQK